MDFSDSFDDLFPKGALKGILDEGEPPEGEGEFSGQDERRIWSVSEFIFHINSLLDLEYGVIWIEGEVGQVSVPPSGHYYFTLKDDSSCIKSVCFKGRQGESRRFIEEGAHVLCLARPNVYKARGDLQMIVEHVEPWGLGRLRLEFERLKERLAHEGLFEEENKKDIPQWPRRIFVITSPTGAAFRDFVKTARSKFPSARIYLVPSSVQGSEAPRQLIRAIDIAEEYAKDGDVIVLTRGGGSMEDLWAFNDEELARRIFRCGVPVVSAVGHEVDFTICDFVSDVRAATPTAAAHLVCPSLAELEEALCSVRGRLARAMKHVIMAKRHRTSLLAAKLKHPRGVLIEQRLRVDDMQRRLLSAVSQSVSSRANVLAGIKARLAMNSPGFRVEKLRSLLERTIFKAKDEILANLRHKKDLLGDMESRLAGAD
ncbi:MAG: exodeoxyribonuclease VII large subunit, partial [Thermodesulfobacteria bacterium]|nr:exodeoxyribonuclease VII large subunit [Thermodesulfobacteriota bacterium]